MGRTAVSVALLLAAMILGSCCVAAVCGPEFVKLVRRTHKPQLAVYLPLDDGGRMLNDRSGNNRDGNSSGTTRISALMPSGRGAARTGFRAKKGMFVRGWAKPVAAWAMCAFVRLTTAPTGLIPILSDYVATVSRAIYIDSSRRVVVYRYGGGSTTHTSITLTVGATYFLCVGFDGASGQTDVYMYQSGQSRLTSSMTGTAETSSTTVSNALFLAADGHTSTVAPAQFDLDEVIVWDSYATTWAASFDFLWLASLGRTCTESQTRSASPSLTLSVSNTDTGSHSATRSLPLSETPTLLPSSTLTPQLTATRSLPLSRTPTLQPSSTLTTHLTATRTFPLSKTPTLQPSSTLTPQLTATRSLPLSGTPTLQPSSTLTAQFTPTRTQLPSGTTTLQPFATVRKLRSLTFSTSLARQASPSISLSCSLREPPSTRTVTEGTVTRSLVTRSRTAAAPMTTNRPSPAPVSTPDPPSPAPVSTPDPPSLAPVSTPDPSSASPVTTQTVTPDPSSLAPVATPDPPPPAPPSTPNPSSPAPVSTQSPSSPAPSVAPRPSLTPPTLEPTLPPQQQVVPALRGTLTLQMDAVGVRRRRSELQAAIAEAAQVEASAVRITSILPGSTVVQFEILTRQAPDAVTASLVRASDASSNSLLAAFAPVADTLTLKAHVTSLEFGIGVSFWVCVGLAVFGGVAALSWQLYRLRHPPPKLKATPIAKLHGGALRIQVVADGVGEGDHGWAAEEAEGAADLFVIGPRGPITLDDVVRIPKHKTTGGSGHWPLTMQREEPEGDRADAAATLPARSRRRGGSRRATLRRDGGGKGSRGGGNPLKGGLGQTFDALHSDAEIETTAGHVGPPGMAFRSRLMALQPSREVVNGDIDASYALE